MQPRGEEFGLWVPGTAQDLIALHVPFELLHVPISLPKGGPFTKQPCLKMELLWSGPPGPEKNTSTRN